MNKNLKELLNKQMSNCFRKYGVFFAFSNSQFDEHKKEGVKYVSLGAGMICPKEAVKEYTKELDCIIKSHKKKDIAQNGFKKIIERELYNYECFYTGDISDCIEALSDYGITESQINEVYNELRKAA